MRIDINKVIEALEVCRDQNNPPGYRCTSCEHDCPYYHKGCASQLKVDSVELLKRQQVIYDSPNLEWIVKWTDGAWQYLPDKMQELVRCKDCIYFGNADKCIVQRYLHEHPETIWFLSLQEDWFCADGVKKR